MFDVEKVSNIFQKYNVQRILWYTDYPEKPHWKNPFGLVDFVWEPRYSTRDFIVDGRVKKFKAPYLKVRFFKVSETNEWSGDWVISKKEAGRRKFNNNGLMCYVISLDKLERLELKDHCEHEM